MNIEILYKLIQKYDKLYLCFIDLNKAFDSINRTKLIKELYKYNINKILIKKIEYLYKNINIIIVGNDNKISEKLTPTRGIIQGCPISPILFITFLADIQFIFKKYKTVSLENKFINTLEFADDIVIIASSKTELQNKISIFKEYIKNKDFTINLKKTQILIYGDNNNSTFKWDNHLINVVNEVKYLGFYFNNSVKSISRKFYIKISILYKLLYDIVNIIVSNFPDDLEKQINVMHTIIISRFKFGLKLAKYMAIEELVKLENLQINYLNCIIKNNQDTIENKIIINKYINKKLLFKLIE